MNILDLYSNLSKQKNNKPFLFVKQKHHKKLQNRTKNDLFILLFFYEKSSNRFDFKALYDKLFIMKKIEKFGKQGNRAGVMPYEESPDSD